MTKVCTKCKEEKDESGFGKDKHARDGLTHQCKTCRSKSASEWNKNNRKRINQKQKYGRPGSKNGNYKHGMRYDPIYWAWCTMINRCESPNDKAYSNYGGRGIYVCDRWRENFENFYEDMGDKPSKKHTLDRIDHNGPYSPENCRWATYREQANNRRNTIWLTYEGETKPLSVWAEELGMPLHRLYTRKLAGHSDKEAITGERDGVLYPDRVYNEEVWRRATYEEFSDFLQVSSHGRFFVEERISSGRKLESRYTIGSITGEGYRLINLMMDGKTYARSAHQIVAAAFIDPDASFRGMVVHHIDSNRENNHVNNLCFCSQSHNNLMGKRKGD